MPHNSREPSFINPFRPSSQLYRLLEHFRTHPNEWIPMPTLTKISGSYVVHSKVAELRRLQIGHFENVVERVEQNGESAIQSRYRFVPNRSDYGPNTP
jgi:hypothetical protein